jgi:phage FluMu protein Com
MQVRCMQCHKPFALGKDAVYAALDTVHDEELSHYNAFCPHCRKANRLSKEELLRAAPDWNRTVTDEEVET